MAAGNKANDLLSPILRGLSLLIKNCTGPHIARMRASAMERSSKVVRAVRKVEEVLPDSGSVQSVNDNSPLYISRLVSFCDVLLLSSIDTAPDRDFFAVPAFHDFKAASSTRLKRF